MYTCRAGSHNISLPRGPPPRPCHISLWPRPPPHTHGVGPTPCVVQPAVCTYFNGLSWPASDISDNDRTGVLRTQYGKSLTCYLAGNFGKLNILNKDLQGANATLLSAKTKISGFIAKLQLYKCQISSGIYDHILLYKLVYCFNVRHNLCAVI